MLNKEANVYCQLMCLIIRFLNKEIIKFLGSRDLKSDPLVLFHFIVE